MDNMKTLVEMVHRKKKTFIQWILTERAKRFGLLPCGEKDNPLLDFSEMPKNKNTGKWAKESILAQ
jgi:hypothetical protein